MPNPVSVLPSFFLCTGTISIAFWRGKDRVTSNIIEMEYFFVVVGSIPKEAGVV